LYTPPVTPRKSAVPEVRGLILREGSVLRYGR
jgi:hypothetical protein